MFIPFFSYGDRIARSFSGRFFTVVWTLVGLILMSFLLADVTSALISYSVEQTTNKKLYGAKVGLKFCK